jgi:hypothetical protein
MRRPRGTIHWNGEDVDHRGHRHNGEGGDNMDSDDCGIPVEGGGLGVEAATNGAAKQGNEGADHDTVEAEAAMNGGGGGGHERRWRRIREIAGVANH